MKNIEEQEQQEVIEGKICVMGREKKGFLCIARGYHSDFSDT